MSRSPTIQDEPAEEEIFDQRIGYLALRFAHKFPLLAEAAVQLEFAVVDFMGGDTCPAARKALLRARRLIDEALAASEPRD